MFRTRVPDRLVLVLTLLSAAMLNACTHVEPWQRGTLARVEMMWDPDPLMAAHRDHAYFSKEASTGGSQSAAGGSGCN